MIRNTPGRILAVLGVVTGLMGCTSPTKVAPEVVPMGNNTFAITCSAENGFTRDTEVLKNQAQRAAADYCAGKGKQLKVVSLTDEKPLVTTGFVKAKIVFKALDANDPELSGAMRAAPAPAASPGVAEPPAPPVDVYTEVMKLDELRKKGLLTDEEFQSEKQKVLRRSK